MTRPGILFLLIILFSTGWARAQTTQVSVDFAQDLGPMRMEQMALGQGGLSEESMLESRIPEIRALQPAVIRLFVSEYYDLLPRPGEYHFGTLDTVVHSVLQTGAKPLMSICFKPAVLFPIINDTIVEPNDYEAWEELVYQLVKHYRDQGAGIRYWEVGNEVDIGEDGGTPYEFKPDSYVRYYRHTVAAVLRADPEARVGGPALAFVESPIFPALLEACSAEQLPLHFVSWHLYNSDPLAVRATIEYAQGLLKEYPDLNPETMMTEWNMDLLNPPLDPRFQPCYVAESIWQMKDAGLDWSCYYHIRDWYVSYDTFAEFFSPQGTAFMTRWWNRQPQFSGLIDYQNQLRPAYFTFKLLSRLAGNRLPVRSDHEAVHGFATHDPKLRMYNLMLWNFSDEPIQVELQLDALPKKMRVRPITLNATNTILEENHRLYPEPYQYLDDGDQKLLVELAPWDVRYWSFE